MNLERATGVNWTIIIVWSGLTVWECSISVYKDNRVLLCFGLFSLFLFFCFPAFAHVYSWEKSRSLIAGCMILTQAHSLLMVTEEMYHRSSFRHLLSRCLLTGAPHHMASVKLVLCYSSVRDGLEWVWAVWQSQITTRATSEMKLGTESLQL